MPKAPEIAINGRFLTQLTAGVQRFAVETVKAMDHLLGEPAYSHLKGHIELVAPAHARDFALANIPLKRVRPAVRLCVGADRISDPRRPPADAEPVHARPDRETPSDRRHSRCHHQSDAAGIRTIFCGGLRFHCSDPVPARRSHRFGVGFLATRNRKILQRRYQQNSDLLRGRRSHHAIHLRQFHHRQARPQEPAILSGRRHQRDEQEFWKARSPPCSRPTSRTRC